MAQVSDEHLRELARHRGMKLVKSRKKKPGVGDFGKFGLTDMAGNALLGISDDGLAASAEDIREYLRSNGQGTWKQSAEAQPDRPAKKKQKRSVIPDDEAPARRRSRPTAENQLPQRVRAKSSAGNRSRSSATFSPRPDLGIVAQRELEPKSGLAPKAESAAEPALHVRAATEADSNALAILLGQLGSVRLDATEVEQNLALARKAKAGMIVAQVGNIVGCCGWSIVHTIHQGAIGRLTVLLVDKKYRRRGIGAALLEAAENAIRNAGGSQVEAMSDLAINNSHNFFRSLQFEQTSYRFVLGLSALGRERAKIRKRT